MKVKTILLILFSIQHLSGYAQAQQNMFVPTVLVEFFTSEGCSSCPLADEFGTNIRTIADSSKQRVYTLDWHVDLWNQSGWVDPFSDSLYTQRQEGMAKANKQPAMFTPMVFVNGKGALPAGAKGEVGKLIESNIRKPAQNFVLLSASWMPDSKMLLIDYEIKGKIDSCDFMIVLAQNEAYSVPTAGENMGKKLSHHNVVRKVVATDKPTAIGALTMELASAQLDFSQYKLMGILQHKRTKQIFACQLLEFNKK